MKWICVLRRNGRPVSDTMLEVVSVAMESMLSESNIHIYCDPYSEFTQMVVCPMPSNPLSVMLFIEEISRLNPLYAVRIVEGI